MFYCVIYMFIFIVLYLFIAYMFYMFYCVIRKLYTSIPAILFEILGNCNLNSVDRSDTLL